ncbi:LysM peptidoglycan-binding domain-containing protein [Niallia circulans]|uniref:LysM peptidoglycan-binding domain-containing protein n=1 Tax=Niallia circulans TaxID=1397 RepID=A0A553SM75_NIACI|nr:SH3 domain-containing protein [Niallia circulans]TRZ38082.1 LysM peptidoglycan-binding domain-containing protein [Niallia circulans]
MTSLVGTDGELKVLRTERHTTKQVYTTRMEKRELEKNISSLDIRDAWNIRSVLESIKDSFMEHVTRVRKLVQESPAKRLVVTGIFTILFSLGASTASACIQEYTYEVKKNETVSEIAKQHGVTAEAILTVNGKVSNGDKILLPKVQDKKVSATVLNIRAKATTDSSIIGKKKQGEVVKVSFTKNGWAGVLIDGRLAYVSADYLTDVKGKATEAVNKSVTKYVTADTLRVRSNPSTKAAVIASYKEGTKVSVKSEENGWAQIEYKGKKAYISSAYLTKTAPSSEPSKAVTKTDSKTYTIKKGDTFYKISKSFGISVSLLQEANPKVNATKLRIDQVINIPAITSSDSLIKVEATIGGISPDGTVRFITTDGITYAAKAGTDGILNSLYDNQGKKLTLTVKAKRGEQMMITAIK